MKLSQKHKARTSPRSSGYLNLQVMIDYWVLAPSAVRAVTRCTRIPFQDPYDPAFLLGEVPDRESRALL